VLTFGAAAATTKLVLKSGAKISVATAGGDIIGTSAYANVGLLVAATGTETGTNKNVTASGTDWTVTTDSSLTSDTVILGKIQFAITTDDANVVAGASATAAGGSLTAGTGTDLILAGKS
jgi:hypothetical protein